MALVSEIQSRRFVYLLLSSFGLMYVPVGAIPSRKFYIKAPANCGNSVYFMMEICHQRSKRLEAQNVTKKYLQIRAKNKYL